MSTMGSTGGPGPASTGSAAQASTGASMQQSTGMSAGSSTSSTGGPASQSSTFTATAGSTGAISFKWSEGWREQIAGGDAKVLQRLARFNTPEDVYRSYTALEARMSSGEFKTALKADATDEEKAQWRKDNGIPETSAGYKLDFDDGTVIGEDEKPAVDQFLEAAHAQGYTNDQVKKTLSWYFSLAEKQTEEMAAHDKKAAQSAQDALRAKWGAEYRPNINSIHSLLDQAPKGMKDLLLNGRLADGTPIGSSPATLEWLAGMSRMLNPYGTVVPAGTLNAGQAISDELSKLKGMMGNKNSPYWKGPEAEKHQARFRELTEANNRLATQGVKK